MSFQSGDPLENERPVTRDSPDFRSGTKWTEKVVDVNYKGKRKTDPLPCHTDEYSSSFSWSVCVQKEPRFLEFMFGPERQPCHPQIPFNSRKMKRFKLTDFHKRRGRIHKEDVDPVSGSSTSSQVTKVHLGPRTPGELRVEMDTGRHPFSVRRDTDKGVEIIPLLPS